jgi:ribonuclease HI
MQEKETILYFDGGSRGNPGQASGAAVIVLPSGEQYAVSEFLNHATNNEAEYTGLIVGLQKARDLGLQKIIIKGDSKLVINQVKGSWKINSDRLGELCQIVRKLISQFQHTNLIWIPREQNKLADAAANKCMDRGERTTDRHSIRKKEPKAKFLASTQSPVEKLIALGKQAKFKDYANLKSGRDEFTSKKINDLKKLIPEESIKEIDKNWDGNDTYLAKVYRWYLRGLPVEMALKKVRTDAEIEENATGVHPWLHNTKSANDPNPKICQYARGDIVVIKNKYSEENGKIGTIVSQPQLLPSGTWSIEVQIEDRDSTIKLNAQDIKDLEI